MGPRITKQINLYIKEYNFSYSGILRTLIYFYDIRGNTIEASNGGIGIVPYVYEEAYRYYYSLWLAKQKNQGKDLKSFIPKDKEVHIQAPKRKTKKSKRFSFLDEDIGVNE